MRATRRQTMQLCNNSKRQVGLMFGAGEKCLPNYFFFVVGGVYAIGIICVKALHQTSHNHCDKNVTFLHIKNVTFLHIKNVTFLHIKNVTFLHIKNVTFLHIKNVTFLHIKNVTFLMVTGWFDIEYAGCVVLFGFVCGCWCSKSLQIFCFLFVSLHLPS
jgi:hypothetical protein